MSANLMDMVKGAVTNEIMGKLGGLLGQSDTKQTQSLFETAGPGSILGGMIKKASTPSGANDIFKSVQNHDDGILDKLGDLLGGGGQEEQLIKSGGGILDGVFGSDKAGMLGTIAKFLGLDEGIVGKLLAMAAPIVMGVIGRHVKSKALDAVGLGSLLGEQKSSLGGLLPSSLTSSLGFGDILGDASDAIQGAAGSVAGAANEMGRSAAQGVEDTAAAGGSLLKFLLPLILLGALAWFGYQMINSGAAEQGDGDVGAAGAVAAMGDIDFGNFDMQGLQTQFTGITDAFKNGVTMDNAGALATKIQDLTGSISDMGIGNLEGAAKDSVFGAIGTFKDTITKAMEGISNQGILDLLQPIVEKLMEVLGGFK